MNYTISNEYVCLTVSDLGAEIQSIIKDGKEYLWNGDEKYWPERSPLLFPYVGRFTDGKYLLKGTEYEMGIHGFARHLPYSLVEKSENTLVFELCDNEDTLKAYPYHFILQVCYELTEDTISITYNVRNLSDERMYFGIGGHPGFALPFDEGLDFSDYYLEFEGKSFPTRVGHTETCFLSGQDESFPLKEDKYLPLVHTMFDDDAIVLKNMADKVTLKSDKGNRQVIVSYPDLPYLGLWHAPKTEAPYICIEPWTSLPSRQDVVEEFTCKYDLIRVDADEEYTNAWSIRIV
jgi:galactose mutarotase-like enzyme